MTLQSGRRRIEPAILKISQWSMVGLKREVVVVVQVIAWLAVAGAVVTRCFASHVIVAMVQTKEDGL